DFALQLARRAAVAIENARLFRDAEQALRDADESSALLDAFFMRSPIAKAFLDRDLRYVRVNEAMAEIHGLPAAESIGRTVEEAVPELAPQIVPCMRRALAGESIVDVEVSGPRPGRDGRAGHWLASYYPVPTATGEVLGVGVLVADITARKNSEQALQA